jgi:hypothetical protein
MRSLLQSGNFGVRVRMYINLELALVIEKPLTRDAVIILSVGLSFQNPVLDR